MRILVSVALLAYCSLGASAAETDAQATYPDQVIEEIVVKAVNWCGIWPIQHQGAIGCEYAELEKNYIPRVLELRTKVFPVCLQCQGIRCSPVVWEEGKVTEKLMCRRLFWTPRKVARLMPDNKHSGHVSVSFTFAISTAGRVQAIEIVSFESDTAEEEVLKLIEYGATKTRFEPLVIADVAYEVVGLKGAFILDES
jgi:hypothetical protein